MLLCVAPELGHGGVDVVGADVECGGAGVVKILVGLAVGDPVRCPVAGVEVVLLLPASKSLASIRSARAEAAARRPSWVQTNGSSTCGSAKLSGRH